MLDDISSKNAAPSCARLADVAPGARDPRGRMITDVFWAVAEYRIYRTAKGVSPFFSDDPDRAAQQRARYLAIGSEISRLNHLIQIETGSRFWGEHKPEAAEERADLPEIVALERELARCIAIALDGDADLARKSLHELTTRLEKQISNRARVNHLIVAGLLAALAWAMSFAYLRYNGESGALQMFAFTVPQHIALASIMGAFGALFSTAVGLKNMSIDPTVKPFMHITYAFVRVLVGVMGAVILYFGFQSGVFAGFLQASGAEVQGSGDASYMYWLGFVSVLAGFSERMVPNLLDSRANAAMAEAKPGAGDDA